MTAVTPHPTYVSVVMQVDSDVKVPASAIATLMAPDLVNDRYIQLDPVYRHGAVMADNAVIPMQPAPRCHSRWTRRSRCSTN